jgi:hypothetical protein
LIRRKFAFRAADPIPAIAWSTHRPEQSDAPGEVAPAPVIAIWASPAMLGNFTPSTKRARMQQSNRRDGMSDHDEEHRPVRRVLWARLLLVLPFIAMLFVSSYNSAEPMLAGIPFFYWYQLLWILIGAALIAFVYAVER